MSFLSVAVGIGSALIGSAASSHASGQAAGAANNATNAQQQMFNTTNQQQAPWRQAGMNALSQLFPTQARLNSQNRVIPGVGNLPGTPMSGPAATLPGQQVGSGQSGDPRFGQLGNDQTDPNNPGGANLGADGTQGNPAMGDSLDPQFQTAAFQFDPSAAVRDYISPAYEFMKNQGLGAVTNSAAGTSGLVSGNALKGLSDYASNYAMNSYLPALQQGFSNQLGQYNANQANTSNIFNRLSTIAGMGSASANTSAGVGAQTGGNIGNSMIAGGQASAAGTMGVGNALSGGLNTYALLRNIGSGSSSSGLVDPTQLQGP